jgi:hypothetical protein
MIFSENKLYGLLKEKIGEKEAEAFIEHLESKVRLDERKIEYVLEKELKDSLLTKAEAFNNFASKEYFAKLEARFMLRLTYFWIGQIVLIAILLLYFFMLKGSGLTIV